MLVRKNVVLITTAFFRKKDGFRAANMIKLTRMQSESHIHDYNLVVAVHNDR